MDHVEIISHSPQETILLAKQITKGLKPGSILCLFGNLGSGKTTFVKGLAEGLNVDAKKVNSPTFVFMNHYEGKVPLYHFDLYRIENSKEMGILGYEEFVYGHGIAVIEWAQKMEQLLPKEYLGVWLEHQGEQTRRLRLEAKGKNYIGVINKLKHSLNTK